MSFTCPDCLWISNNPNDEQHLYCGHCHQFKNVNLLPTTFEVAVIKAIRSSPQLAPDRLRRLVTGVDWPEPLYMGQILWSLTRLGEARRILPHQRAVIEYARGELERLSRSNPPIR